MHPSTVAKLHALSRPSLFPLLEEERVFQVKVPLGSQKASLCESIQAELRVCSMIHTNELAAGILRG